MRDKLRATFAAAITLALILSLLTIVPVAAAAKKVVIIVGPTGAQTDSYRNTGDSIAETAADAGAQVVKVYSPNATWANVRAAVNGANVIVYLGHGNGYPNPYGSTELTDRANGWGLNRNSSNGDGDNWSTTMVYCGEKALLGTLTAYDGAAQRQYCTGGISPAPNFVMIYNKACYAPGAGESWDAKASQTQAFQRVRHYSYPVLKKGAGAYFATDMWNGAEKLVDLVLRNPHMSFGDIARNGNGYSEAAQKTYAHPDLSGRRVWIQRTSAMGSMDYWYAFAGDPSNTPAGGDAAPDTGPVPEMTKKRPVAGSHNSGPGVTLRAWFDMNVRDVDESTFTLRTDSGELVPADVTWNWVKKRANLKPNAPLTPGERYTATLSSEIHSKAGAHFAGYTWRFWIED